MCWPCKSETDHRDLPLLSKAVRIRRILAAMARVNSYQANVCEKD